MGCRMGQNRKFTDELAVRILDKGIERCRKSLITLEVGTDDFDNVFMEMRSYQIHKETLLKGGGANDF